MEFQTLYISVFLGFALFHSCCAGNLLQVYTGPTVTAIIAAYDEQKDTSVTKANFEIYQTIAVEMTKRLAVSLAKFNIPWNIDESFAAPEPLQKWMRLYRLTNEAKVALATLKEFKFQQKEKALWKPEDHQKRTIVVIVGYGGNGFNSGYIALELYNLGYNVVVVGMPTWNGLYKGHPEFDHIRRQIMIQHLDYENPAKKRVNSFKYIEICSEDILFGKFSKNIPAGELYIEGHMGTGPDFQSDGTFAIAMINYLNKIQKSGVKTITIDSALYLHHTYGRYRFKDMHSNPLPSHKPNGTIFINFVPPYVLTPNLKYTWNSDTGKMDFKQSVVGFQMSDVTFAVAIFDEVHTFVGNLSEKQKIIEKCLDEYTRELDNLISNVGDEYKTIKPLLEVEIADHAIAKPDYSKLLKDEKEILYLNADLKQYDPIPKPAYKYLSSEKSA